MNWEMSLGVGFQEMSYKGKGGDFFPLSFFLDLLSLFFCKFPTNTQSAYPRHFYPLN